VLDLRASIVAQIEAAGGRHDEPEIYDGAPGDAGIGGGPGSISWEINGDLASLVVSGTAAIIMEVLHPSVMAGVFTQSSYRTEPLKRARSTLGYVLRTTFGSTQAAGDVITRVKRIHASVGGTRADGVAYQALDPTLIAWVHTCIPWAVMRAYETYNRPLEVAEKNRYLAEQAVIGRMGGAEWVPETVDFIGFLAGRGGDQPLGLRERYDRWVGIRGSMGLMPEWARRMTGTYVPDLPYRLWFAPSDRLKASLIRWAYPELPCKAMALARAGRGARDEAAA
jgi:uncharacterized protein (DUF2236 family)